MILMFFTGAAGALLAAYSFHIARHSNFNFGVLIIWCLTVFVWLVHLFHRQAARFASTLPGHIILGLLAAGVCVYTILLIFVAASGYACRVQRDEKALIVLGAALHGSKVSSVLQYRLDAAYDYYTSNPNAIIVTSGGQGHGEDLPEGEAMRQYLIARGVPEGQVFAETDSTSTEENFIFSAGILEEQGITKTDSIGYCTNAFHCYRAGQYAKLAGFTDARALPAGISAAAAPTCYLREVFAVLYYWVFRSSRTGWMHPFVGTLHAVIKNGWRI